MKALLALLILAGAAPAADAVYYVATTGNDATGDGSAATPWATVGAAAAKLPDAGGTVIVRDGVYIGSTVLRRKFSGYAVFRAEHPYQAKLQASNGVTLYFLGAAYIEFTNFEITRGDPGGTYPLNVQIDSSSSIVLRDNIIHDSYNYDLIKMTSVARNVLIIGNVFYNAYGPAGQHIDVNGCPDVTIRDNIFFADYEGSGQPDNKDSGGFIVVKNSAQLAEPTRRTRITSNVFLRYQGGEGRNFICFGEDGSRFYETQDGIAENNLMIGNNTDQMRAPFGVKGAKNIVFRNNTAAGQMYSKNYITRMTAEGYNPPNQSISFLNNIWSNPNGTMSPLLDIHPAQNMDVVLLNNVYWNGGKAIPGPTEPSMVHQTDDAQAILSDPMLGSQAQVILPRWVGETFLSGAKTVREEFERLVRLYGVPDASSGIVGRSDPAYTPAADILDRPRSGNSDPGAVDSLAAGPPLRIVAVPESVVGGLKTTLNQIILDQPAGGLCGSAVLLSSSDPSLVSAPPLVRIPANSSAATFELRTAAVEEATPVTLTATYKGSCEAPPVSKTTVLTLVPERLTVDLTMPTVTASTSFERNQVLIEGVAPPEGLTITLASSRPEVIVPETVTIPAGATASEFFTVHTSFVGEQTPIEITAALGETVTGSAVVTLIPPKYQLQLATDSTTEGSLLKGNYVILDSLAPAGGALVRLTNSRPDVLAVPAVVMVPEGTNLAAFEMSALGVNTTSTATITATYAGRSASATCAVWPNRLSAITTPYPTLIGSAKPSITVRTLVPVMANTTVALSQSSPAVVSIPASVTIPAGTSAGSFIAATPYVTEPTNVVIYATYRTQTAAVTLTLNPVDMWDIALAQTARPGDSIDVVVYVNAPAPPGGLEVKMSSSDPVAFPVPDTIRIEPGTTTTHKYVKVGAVSSATDVTVSAVLRKTVAKKMRIQP